MTSNEQPSRFCPYLGRTTADEFSLDHIIPEVIGGKRDFGIDVSKERNGFLGTRIEQPAFDNLIFRFDRQRCGVKGKSKVPNVSIIVDVANSGSLRYELIMKPDGSVEHSLRDIKQVQSNGAEGTQSIAVYKLDGVESTADKIIEAVESRGEVLSCSESVDESPKLTATVEIDTMRIRQAMAKMAYGAACKWLPNYAESDPGATLVRSFIFEEDQAQAAAVELHGRAFLPSDCPLLLLLSNLDPCEHRVAIIASGGKLIGLVRLFGDSPWNMLVELSSNPSQYGWVEGKMQVASCLTSAATTDTFETSIQEVAAKHLGGVEE